MGLCLTVNLPILFESVHDHSGGDIPGPIPNPEVKTSCVVPCTVVREPTEKVVVVSLSPFAFTGASAPVGATSPHFSSTMADRLDLHLDDPNGTVRVGWLCVTAKANARRGRVGSGAGVRAVSAGAAKKTER